MGRQHDIDPLAAALQPPQDETPEERRIRLHAEDVARKLSEAQTVFFFVR